MAGAGVAQRLLAVQVLQAGREVDAGVAVRLGGVLVVLERVRHVDVDAAEGVDQLLEPAEVDLRIVVDVDPEVAGDRPPEQPILVGRRLPPDQSKRRESLLPGR